MLGKRSAALLLVVVALGGCGGDGEPAESEDEIERVQNSVVGFGTTQGVRCADAGATLRELAVVRCSFEEEEDVSGAMRAQDRCYVVESGAVVDVTRELPIGTLRSCTVSAP